MFEYSFEKSGEPSSEVELIVCKSVAVFLLAGHQLPIFLQIR